MFQIADQSIISIRESALEIVDMSISRLLNRKTQVKIDLSKNVNLKCAGLEWMAQYIKPFGHQLTIDEAKCADKGNQLLSNYLVPFESTTTSIAADSSTSPVGSTTVTQKSSTAMILANGLIITFTVALAALA